VGLSTIRSVTWQRLSVRRGRADAEVLVEGIPDYLTLPLVERLRREFGWFVSGGGLRHDLMQRVATATRIPVTESHEHGGISSQIISAIEADDDLFLDVLDATLHLAPTLASASLLRRILDSGASAWTVSPAGDALQKRVDDAAAEAYTVASSVDDQVAAELDEAWAAAFGRNPDPSDAWDHAIKAVEELLIPMVLRGATKPNLGGVAGQLEAASHKWELTPTTSSQTIDDAKTLAAMIRLIWPNPDRHGGGPHRRAPEQPEAERVVHLAVAIVQLCRASGLTRVERSLPMSVAIRNGGVVARDVGRSA
jgi:hypothetical protein